MKPELDRLNCIQSELDKYSPTELLHKYKQIICRKFSYLSGQYVHPTIVQKFDDIIENIEQKLESIINSRCDYTNDR